MNDKKHKHIGRRTVGAVMSGVLSMSMLAGCEKQPSAEDQQAAALAAEQQVHLIEVNQNDYRGAIFRVESIKQALMGVVDTFNERNNAITSEHPSDFWSSDSYKYLGMNLLNNDVWFETSYFNETETTWDEAVQYAQAQFLNEQQTAYTVQNLSIERPEANVYKMTYTEPNIKVPYYKNGDQGYTFFTTYEVTYDANHDWAQCARYRTAGNNKICDGLFEYARISETEFVVQTETERMYVRYADGLYDYPNGPADGSLSPADGDGTPAGPADGGAGSAAEEADGGTAASDDAAAEQTPEGQAAEGQIPEGQTAVGQTPEGQAVPQGQLHDPLAEKPVAEFYYSQLNGDPRYEYAEVVVPDEGPAFFSFFSEDSNIIKQGFNNVDEENNWVCIYNTNDSIFNNMSELGKDWVFSDNGRFKLSLSYYDDMLVVKNENTLINMLECTNFLVDGTTESYQEEIYVPEIILDKTDDEIVMALAESNDELIPLMTELSTNGFNFGDSESFENIMENRNFDMVNYNGKSYDITDDRTKQREQMDREIVKSYVPYETEYYIDNTYALPSGYMYFVSSVDADLEGNRVSDNNNYYTMLYEYEVQDDYTIKYNSYYLVSDNPDCLMMLQNIKPRSTTRERVEIALGEPRDLSNVDVLDEEGLVKYSVSFDDSIAAYRCENGIVYVMYDDNDIVQIVGMYTFNEPQGLDTVYVEPQNPEGAAGADAKAKK